MQGNKISVYISGCFLYLCCGWSYSGGSKKVLIRKMNIFAFMGSGGWKCLRNKDHESEFHGHHHRMHAPHIANPKATAKLHSLLV